VSEPSAGMMVTSNVRLVRPLGEGGMGAVWVAEHLSLRTQVVVKFMARDLTGSGEALARFSREAAAASQVKSPHVVQMFDHGVLEGGAPYIVMELLEGRDLEQQLRASGRLSPREVAAIVAQLARALSKAHERGIVHRDIKPSNVFLCDAGGGDLFVKLLDFGIAKGPEVGIIGSTTRTGSFIGSPYYMSPEQVVGAKTIDFRTDLWSLGVVAFEALTGEKPFYAETVGALALKIHRDALPVPTKTCPSLPLAVDAWFVRACAREPEERYASAREMAEALALSVGEGLAPGLQLDAVPAPSGGDGSVLSPASETFPSGVDARSETGGGVGLVASERMPAAARGRWVALAGIAVAAVGIGFLVPRLMTRPVAAAPSAAPLLDTMAATAAPSPEPTPVPVPPVSLAPALSPPVLSSLQHTLSVAPPSAPAPHASAPRTHPSSSAASSSSAPAHPSAAAPSHPPPGSDDDIK
jgi:serine/threonine protein kinase